MTSRLNGKTVLITGASAGIGEACAREYARAGAHLILTARRVDRLASLAKELTAQHPAVRVHPIEMDVRNREQVFAAIEALPAEFRDIDVLVNNAGLALGTEPAATVSMESVDTMFDTNVKGLINVTQAVLPVMKKRNSGHIVNVSSVAGTQAYPGGSIYCASKHAVDAFTRALRMELVSTAINVTSIDPGLVETEFSLVRFGGDKERAAGPYVGLTPLSGEDIAESIVFATSRRPHVQITTLQIFPTNQASAYHIHREQNRVLLLERADAGGDAGISVTVTEDEIAVTLYVAGILTGLALVLYRKNVAMLLAKLSDPALIANMTGSLLLLGELLIQSGVWFVGGGGDSVLVHAAIEAVRPTVAARCLGVAAVMTACVTAAVFWFSGSLFGASQGGDCALFASNYTFIWTGVMTSLEWLLALVLMVVTAVDLRQSASWDTKRGMLKRVALFGRACVDTNAHTLLAIALVGSVPLLARAATTSVVWLRVVFHTAAYAESKLVQWSAARGGRISEDTHQMRTTQRGLPIEQLRKTLHQPDVNDILTPRLSLAEA
ncbi:hypothetical protein HK105_208465 [Polyrhizophydium stewartii]|uniref:Ketoreductase domain-containing protein n=1 Tax=Polyrhizophydium stewartii TaxID=2732419 RepID=A0ABR4MXP8_9FUNG